MVHCGERKAQSKACDFALVTCFERCVLQLHTACHKTVQDLTLLFVLTDHAVLSQGARDLPRLQVEGLLPHSLPTPAPHLRHRQQGLPALLVWRQVGDPTASKAPQPALRPNACALFMLTLISHLCLGGYQHPSIPAGFQHLANIRYGPAFTCAGKQVTPAMQK